MGRLRVMSRLVWSRLGYVASCAATAAGAGMEFGLGWGLIVAGVLGGGSCLLLVDVGPADTEETL